MNQFFFECSLNQCDKWLNLQVTIIFSDSCIKSIMSFSLLTDCPCDNMLLNIYIYAFSRRFYPKRLTVVFRLYIQVSICVPWESNPQPFVLLTQCSTTEPHRNMCCTTPVEQGYHFLVNSNGIYCKYFLKKINSVSDSYWPYYQVGLPTAYFQSDF